MEQRFRRERNISQRVEPKIVAPAVPKKQSQKSSPTDKAEFSESFFSAYRSIMDRHAWKKAALLIMVLVLFL